MATGDRVKQAREFCGLTQTELARRVGVSQPAIHQIEVGETPPSARVLEAIAFQTGFPISRFNHEPLSEFPLGSLIFRSRRAMTKRERDQVYRHGEVVYEAAARMADRVAMGPVRLPRLNRSDVESPAHAAALARASLGLSPETPIKNLVDAVERAGVFVLSIPLHSQHASAYSLWAGDRPVVVTFAGVPGDRLRMSVAHEVGHLVLHEQLMEDEKQRELDAFAFAGELLMPGAPARAEMTAPVTLSKLAHLKVRWRISIAGLIMHATRLEIITARQQRYLYQQLSQRGWRTHEPPNLDVPIERPRAIRKMAELLYGDPPDLRRLASELTLPIGLVQNLLTEGATLADMPRVGPVAEPTPNTSVKVDAEPAPDNLRDLGEHRDRQRG